MKRNTLLLLLVIALSCKDQPKHVEVDVKLSDTTPKTQILPAHPDTTPRDYISVIRENYQRIQNITKWTKVEKRYLDISAEGGEAFYYYRNNNLEKIKAVITGEMGQSTTEYYFMDGALSFVFERSLAYKKPLDIKNAKVTETRSYFKNYKLVKQLHSDTGNTPVKESILPQRESEIMDAFGKVMGPLEEGVDTK